MRKSKAQRDPVVWQPQEPILPLNCQAPTGQQSLLGFCKQQKENLQPEKTVGSCQDELQSRKQERCLSGQDSSRLLHRQDPGKTEPPPDFQAAKKAPHFCLEVPRTPRGVDVSRLLLTHMCAHAVSVQLTDSQNSPLEPAPKKQDRPQKPLAGMTATPTKRSSP